MKNYDVGGDKRGDESGFLSTRKDDTYSQVCGGHHKDDILIGTGFRGDGSIEPTNVFIASTATIEACAVGRRLDAVDPPSPWKSGAIVVHGGEQPGPS